MDGCKRPDLKLSVKKKNTSIGHPSMWMDGWMDGQWMCSLTIVFFFPAKKKFGGKKKTQGKNSTKLVREQPCSLPGLSLCTILQNFYRRSYVKKKGLVEQDCSLKSLVEFSFVQTKTKLAGKK